MAMEKVNERLEEIKKLIVERDKHLDKNGDVTEYSLYDQSVYKLNDYGHIDWLVETIEQQQKELDKLNNLAIIQELKRAFAENERIIKGLDKLKDTIANDVFAVLCDITRGKSL